MRVVGCKYCERSPELLEIAMHVLDLETSVLYLMKNQAYKGRCILALKKHRAELSELSKEELSTYAGEIALTAETLKAVFGADKINYAAYGDFVPHFHFHLVPKYKGGRSWGKPFDLDPTPAVLLGESEYGEMIRDLRSRLSSAKG